MLNGRLFKFWNDLPQALRTGQPQNEIKHGGKGMFEELYAEPARLEQFLGGMTGLSRLNFEAFAEKFDFTSFKTLCDVGGATGLLSIEVAKRHPHLRCVSFDLPAVEPIAVRSIAAAGLTDRVSTANGDFFADPLPQADVITMGMILHDWNLERKKQLIRAAYEALPAGGAFVAIEALIDDARRENLFGLLMSLNMLIEFGDAFDYSAADFEGWCREAGFQRFEVIQLFGPSSAAIAYKTTWISHDALSRQEGVARHDDTVCICPAVTKQRSSGEKATGSYGNMPSRSRECSSRAWAPSEHAIAGFERIAGS